MTYATRTSYSSPSPPPHTRTRKMALAPRSHGRRLNVPEEIADLWLHRGVVAFFINPESTPPTSRLFYIVPRFQRLIFPHCAVAHLSPPTVPLSTSQFSLSLSLSCVPSFLVSFRLTCRWQAFSTAFSSPPSAAYASLRLHSPHCHWQTNLNGSIKSIRSNGT